MRDRDNVSVLDTLADLVRINSVNPRYEGGVNELEIANYVASFFSDRKIEVWKQEVYPGRPNVIARIPGRDRSRRVVLEAHLDTVSAVGMTIDPFDAVIRDGKLFGRGACDTKAGLAAMMHAMAGLADESFTPAADVLMAAVIDEEFSYRGVVAFCDSREPGPVDPMVLENKRPYRHPLQADAAIIAEPTALRCVTASKGLVRWKIETRGKSAHSAKPHLGVNAIGHMAHLISAIERDTESLSRQSHPLLGPATCNVGVIAGGTQVNLVPDRCVIEIDRRMLPGETESEVLAHYQHLINSVASQHPDLSVTMHPPMLSDRPLETDPGEVSVKAMRSVLRELGIDDEPIGVPFCSDASKFGSLGIPSMILGPGSIDQAHAAVEYLDCDEVRRAVDVYQSFLKSFE